MTVTRMATSRGPIPVTVDTFEAYHGGWGGEYRGGEWFRVSDLGFRMYRGWFRV